jgi:putative transposase
MNIQRTIPIIIEKCQALLDTVIEFNRFQKAISPIAFNGGKPLSAIELQKQTYHIVPTTLRSQMKCSAIRLTSSSYSSAKSNHHQITKAFEFRNARALFLVGKGGKDASFHKDGIVSINSIHGRLKLPYKIPKPFVDDFKNAVEIDSVMIDKHGKATLCVTLNTPDPKGIVPVGVDLGINNAIVASTKNGKHLFIKGDKLQIANKKTRKVRQRLQQKLTGRKAQKKDTRSVRRLLKRLSRKQRNRTRTFCKEAASSLVKWCPSNSVIIFEDLKIPRKRKTAKMRKGTRRKLNQFFYNEMIQAVKNKTERVGITMEFVNPAYTSQICSQCGLIGNRFGHSFLCPHCGFKCHADLNASFNIANKFAVLRSGGVMSATPVALNISVQGQAIAL